MEAVRERPRRDRRGGRARAGRREQGRPRARGGQGAGPRHEGAVVISARTGEGIDDLLRVVGDRLRGRTGSCSSSCRGARGDVLAAVHREGEVVGQSDGEESATLQVVLDDVGRARFAEFVAAP